MTSCLFNYLLKAILLVEGQKNETQPKRSTYDTQIKPYTRDAGRDLLG